MMDLPTAEIEQLAAFIVGILPPGHVTTFAE